MASGGGFAFGPFTLDVATARLLRQGEPVRLTPPQVRVLHALVSRAGEVIDKDTLVTAGWQGAAIADNSLAQAVLRLRRALDARDPDRYIENIPRIGYRFLAATERVAAPRSAGDLDAALAPWRALVDGRAALESLERGEIARARSTFEAALATGHAPSSVHIGLAMACAMQFQMTRADETPDVEALRLAAVHAREACRLDERNGEAWATLGFVLERTPARADALAALRRAVALEPENWRHHLRLSSAAWGSERVSAARRTLAIFSQVPAAHWLAATVLVARGNAADAERELDAGLAAAQDEANGPARFSAVGLHWLQGLLSLARGADAEALASFDRELALEARGHLYARECCANTACAMGACHLRRGDASAARRAFEQALARVPAHPMARAGLAMAGGTPDGDVDAAAASGADVDRNGRSTSVHHAFARAALLVAHGDAPAAAAVVDAAIAAAPPGNSGWTLLVEPLLDIARHPGVWDRALARVRMRAE